MTQQADDHALVEAARAGSVIAFEVLVERYDARLRAFFTRVTGDPELAADLTQETFLDAYRSRNALPTDRPFAAWLYQTARYNLLPIRRRQTLHRIISLDWLTTHSHTVIPSLECPDEVRHVHERDMVQQALDQLSSSLRDALVLSAIGGFPSQEVADILNISPVAARKRISRATAEFQRHYQDRSQKKSYR